MQLFYCLDYGSPDGIQSARCLDTGGFKEITAANGLANEPPRANGSNSVVWNVPRDATTSQGDGDTGAIEVRVTATGASGGTARNTGILFR
ncbi:MAG: hypothetical protein ACR2HR_07670 [Euzebya sp.]